MDTWPSPWPRFERTNLARPGETDAQASAGQPAHLRRVETSFEFGLKFLDALRGNPRRVRRHVEYLNPVHSPRWSGSFQPLAHQMRDRSAQRQRPALRIGMHHLQDVIIQVE